MSLVSSDSEGEQNELRSLQEKLESTMRLVTNLSGQLSELKDQVHEGAVLRGGRTGGGGGRRKGSDGPTSRCGCHCPAGCPWASLQLRPVSGPLQSGARAGPTQTDQVSLWVTGTKYLGHYLLPSQGHQSWMGLQNSASHLMNDVSVPHGGFTR